MDDFCQYKLFKKPQPNLLIPPPYVRASESRGEHKKVPNLQLKGSDPSKLLLFIESLKDTNSKDIEMKINKYLMEELDCQSVFILNLDLTVPEKAVIRVIGNSLLKLDIYIPLNDPLIGEVNRCKDGMHVNLQKLNPSIQNIMSELMPKIEGDIFAFPILLQIHKYGLTEYLDKTLFILIVVDTVHKKSFVHQVVNDTFRFCLPHLLSTIIAEAEKFLRLQSETVAAITRSFFTDLVDFDLLLRKILVNATYLTGSERCVLYLIDYRQKNMLNQYSVNQDSVLQKKTGIAKNKGIPGFIFIKGKLLNMQDPQSHPLYVKSEDDKVGLKTTNLLAAPLRVEKTVIGAIVLCNKELGYTVFEENALKTYCEYSAFAIKHADNYKKIIDTQKRNKVSNQLLLFHLQVKNSDIKHLMYGQKPIIPNFASVEFNPRDVLEHQTGLLIIGMFDELQLTNRFEIDKKTLATFLVFLQRGYNKTPYHNWMHAFCVTHFVYSIVISFQCVQKNILSELEVLSLIIACLCHSVDHKGTTNKFRNNLNATTLGCLFSSDGSVMEMHHLTQTLCILNNEGCNFLVGLAENEYMQCLDMIKSFILATDLVNHMKIIRRQEILLSTRFRPKNPEHKMLFCSLLMTCADLCDQTKGWKTAHTIAAQLYEEYFRQGDLEKAMGMVPEDMMDRDKAFIPILQIEFLRDICHSPFSTLCKIFPAMEFCMDSILWNIRCWDAAKVLFKERDITTCNSLDILRGPEMSLIETQINTGGEDTFGEQLEEESFGSLGKKYSN